MNRRSCYQILWGAMGRGFCEVRRIAASLQVKDRGQYSNHRMMDFLHFSRSTPPWRVAAVMLLAPLPALALITLFELQHLNPPSAGLKENSGFYLREFMAFSTFCIMLLQQFCSQVGPALPMPTSTMICTALITAGLNTGANYLAASVVGFPIPFTITISAIVHFLLQVTALTLVWHRRVSANPSLMLDIVRGCLLLACQCFVVVIYPIYYYVFTLVSESIALRLAILSMLSVIKLFNRQLFNRVCKKTCSRPEYVPQIIVFNADVMSSLFSAFSMQYNPSLFMASCIACGKLFQSVLVILEIRDGARNVLMLRTRLNELGMNIGSNENLAIHIVNEVVQIGREHGAPTKPVWLAKRHSKRIIKKLQRFPRIHPMRPFVSTQESNRGSRLIIVLPVQEPRIASLTKRSAERERLQREYVSLISRLLSMTEFVILVEYVEVSIPVLYCLYLVVMFQSPNRVFYAHFASMDVDNLVQSVGNVLMYTSLEIMTLAMVHTSLSRWLGISPIRQLGFVLTRQAVHVQSSLLLWIVYSTQVSLDHFGNDYTFQFKWLSNNATR